LPEKNSLHFLIKFIVDKKFNHDPEIIQTQPSVCKSTGTARSIKLQIKYKAQAMKATRHSSLLRQNVAR
jgi:hypothetical protein